MGAQTGKAARVFEDRHEQSRKVKPQNPCVPDLYVGFCAKQTADTFVSPVSLGAYPSYFRISQPFGRLPYPIDAMVTEHALDVPDRKFMNWFFVQLIPYSMKQEYPKLPVLLGIRTVDAHNEDGKRNGNR